MQGGRGGEEAVGSSGAVCLEEAGVAGEEAVGFSGCYVCWEVVSYLVLKNRSR